MERETASSLKEQTHKAVLLEDAVDQGQIPAEYRGWWRITESSQWASSKELNSYRLGPSIFSLTGESDRLRMFVLLAYITCKPTKSGVSFTWNGAWEFDPMSGSGRVKLDKDGKLKGVLKIKGGDESTFIAERSEEPKEPIPPPPSYRDKWRRRW